MQDVYSIYDTKAHLSQLLKQVKAGREIIISERGVPIVKMVPLPQEQSFEERLQYLEKTGLILSVRRKKHFPAGIRRPGGLKRFLKDRE